jgi:dicarboxylate/amino acid:cation (Na+ or H+) symporter, DAACS family
MASHESASPKPDVGSSHEPGGVALHWQILIGLLVGILLGGLARFLLPSGADGKPNETLNWIATNVAEPIGQVFLRLIMMAVVPLVFSALALAVVELGDLRKLGRLGLKTFLFTILFSGLSVIIGLALTNTIRPGSRIPEQTRVELSERFEEKAQTTQTNANKAKSLRDSLLDIIPRNPLQEMVGAVDGSSPGGGMLAVMFFALAFGVAMSVAGERTATLVSLLEGVYDTVMVIIQFSMRIAPLGVAGLIFSLTALFGFDILASLVWYVGTVILGLLLQALIVYSAALVVFAKRSPVAFFRSISDAVLTAFATSSSSATLPTALRVTEDKLGITPQVSRFVLTVGATANQNGTALYEGITVLFLAQVFGVELSLAQQATVVMLSILAGVGTAGVPGGSLPLVVIVLQTVGVPAAGIAIILGVDRILDMCRTSLNVTGDIVVAACVEGEQPKEMLSS